MIVVLKTLCGCTRKIELPEEDVAAERIVVPLQPPFEYAVLGENERLPQTQYREFVRTEDTRRSAPVFLEARLYTMEAPTTATGKSAGTVIR